jgi:succinyl-CoA synthetase alpha subunit
VPPPFAADAILEAIDAGIAAGRRITEGIPVLDMVRVRRPDARGAEARASSARTAPASSRRPVQDRHHARAHPQARPRRRRVRSGTLTYEAVGQLTALGIGQSTCVGIGGDPVNGTDFIDVLQAPSTPTRTPTASS